MRTAPADPRCGAFRDRLRSLIFPQPGDPAAILHQYRWLTLPDGSRLFSEEARADGIFYIDRGVIKLIRNCRHRGPRVLWLAAPGNIIGMGGCHSGFHSHSAVALGDVHLCNIALSNIYELLDESPEAAIEMMRHLCSDIKLTESRWLRQAALPGSMRIAIMLWGLRAACGEDGQGFIRAPLTTATITEIVNGKRNAVLRVLRDWQRQGMIEMSPRRIALRQPQKIEALIRRENVDGGVDQHSKIHQSSRRHMIL